MLDELLLFSELEIEEQRAGRNKETAIDHTYINEGEYRRKFNAISDNPRLQRLMYQAAKEMLLHRSEEPVDENYFAAVVAKYLKAGYNEHEAQLKALKDVSDHFKIYFKEVTV